MDNLIRIKNASMILGNIKELAPLNSLQTQEVTDEVAFDVYDEIFDNMEFKDFDIDN